MSWRTAPPSSHSSFASRLAPTSERGLDSGRSRRSLPLTRLGGWKSPSNTTPERAGGCRGTTPLSSSAGSISDGSPAPVTGSSAVVYFGRERFPLLFADGKSESALRSEGAEELLSLWPLGERGASTSVGGGESALGALHRGGEETRRSAVESLLAVEGRSKAACAL